jgi:hypothetical protein
MKSFRFIKGSKFIKSFFLEMVTLVKKKKKLYYRYVKYYFT